MTTPHEPGQPTTVVDPTVLSQQVESFATAWRAGQRPILEDFLPIDPTLRSAVLVPLACVDLQHRLQAGETVCVEDYVERFPELAATPNAVVGLIGTEYDSRRLREPRLSLKEFVRRFPQYRNEIKSLWHSSGQRTSLPSTSSRTQRRPDPPPAGTDEAPAPLTITEVKPKGTPAGPEAITQDLPFNARHSHAERPLPQLPGYTLEGLLGQGGMGVVYRARHVQLQRRVALKMILAGAHAGPEQLDRFLAEARAVAQLQHPNIVQIYEIGEHEGRPYFSLEFVDGGSLAHRLNGTPRPPRQSAHLVRALAQAMHAAHQQGIVHRDLKPANVLLASVPGTGFEAETDRNTLDRQRWVPKIADFGLAKQLGQDTGQTQTGAIMGTPCYMAPEQAEGKVKEIGPAADVYALGVILYELLTGRPPFTGATMMETLEQVRSQEPVPPSRLQPKVPHDLETICLKCLHKEAPQRYASALALAEELQRFLDDEPILARPVSEWTRLWKEYRRNRKVATLSLVATGAIGAVVALAGLLAFFQGQSATRLAEEKRLLLDENTRAEDALRKSEYHRQRMAEFAGMSARLAGERGAALCAEGDVRPGLLWLARALQVAPEEAPGLQQALRRSLNGWQDQTPRVVSLLAQVDGRRAVFSPDGGTVATAGDGRSVQLWNVQTGQRIGAPLEHGQPVEELAFSTDSQRLRTRGAGGDSRVWEAATAKLLGQFAACSPDLKTALRVTKDKAQVVNVLSAETIAELEKPDGALQAAFSLDGRLLATCSGGTDEQDSWVNVFNGHDLSGWKTHPGATGNWKVENGVLVGCGPQSSRLYSPRDYEDFHFRLEAKINHGGSSGLLFRREYSGDRNGGYEAPIGSSGARAKVGGLSVNGKPETTTEPVLVPADTWFTQEVIARGNHIVIKVNGLKTADYVHKEHTWKRGHLALQVLSAAPGRTQDQGKWVRLFNGQDLSGWKSHPDAPGHWTVESGVLSDRSTGSIKDPGKNAIKQQLLFTQRDDYEDFHFRVEVKMDSPGIADTRFAQIFRKTFSSSSTGGYEAFVAAGKDSRKRLKTVAKLMLNNGRPTIDYQKDAMPLDTWFTQEVVAQGNRLTVKINGVQVLDHVDNAETYKRGHLALWGMNRVQFRGVEVKELNVPPVTPTMVQFRRVEVRVLKDSARTVRLWDARTGRPVGAPLVHADAVRSLGFSPDGHTLATVATSGEARLWEAATGKPLALTLPSMGRGNTVNFRPDGQAVATLTGDQAQLWDVNTGQPLSPPLSHTSPIQSAQFSADGQSLAVSGGDRVSLFDLATGQPRCGPLRHGGAVVSLALSADGRYLLTGSADRSARLWETARGQPVSCSLRHSGTVQFVAFSPNGQQFLTADPGLTTHVWQLPQVLAPLTRLGLPETVQALAFSPDRTLAVTLGKETAQFWDVPSGTPRGAVPLPSGRVGTLVFSPDSKRLAIAIGSQVQLADAREGRALGAARTHSAAVRAVAFSPDGKLLLTGSEDRTARLWEAATGKPVGATLAHADWVQAVCFRPDGTAVATGARDGVVQLWNVGTGAALGNALPARGAVADLAFRPDGKQLAVGCADAMVRLWDVGTGKEVSSLPHPGPVRAVRFSPSGRRLLTLSGDPNKTAGAVVEARLWDLPAGKAVGPPLLHLGASVQEALFDMSGALVLTRGRDQTLRMWDAATGLAIGPALAHQEPILAAAFTADGRSVLAGGQEKGLRRWSVPAAVERDVDAVVRQTQVLTGLELDAEGVIHELEAAGWQQRAQRLPPPGKPPP